MKDSTVQKNIKSQLGMQALAQTAQSNIHTKLSMGVKLLYTRLTLPVYCNVKQQLHAYLNNQKIIAGKYILVQLSNTFSFLCMQDFNFDVIPNDANVLAQITV